MRFAKPPIAEQALAVGSQIESWLTDVSASLGDLGPEEIAEGVEPALERLGSLLQVDACFLAECPTDPEDAGDVWAWMAPGAGGGASLATVARDQAAWLARRAESAEELLAGRADDVPDAFRRAGVRSLAILPLWAGDTPAGTLGLATVRAEREWTAGLLRRVRLLGDVLAAALDRRRTAGAAERSAHFERLLTDVVTSILDGDERGPEVEDALQAMAELAGAERAGLFRATEGGTRLEPVRVWCEPGAGDPERVRRSLAREASLGWLVRRLGRGEDVAAAPGDLPRPATRERRHFARLGIRAFARLPLAVRGEVRGVLALDSLSSSRAWPEALRDRLRLAGRLLLWALEKHDRGDRDSRSVAVAPGPPGLALPAGLEGLPPGTSILVLGDAAGGREIVLRTPLGAASPGPARTAWAWTDAVDAEELPAAALPRGAALPGALAAPPAPAPDLSLAEVQRTHIARVLADCGGRINGPGHAAERLGLKPSTLRDRMRKLGIERDGTAPRRRAPARKSDAGD